VVIFSWVDACPVTPLPFEDHPNAEHIRQAREKVSEKADQ